ncbi:DinB family protein [Ekhidna sp.]|uniref:DinB family protein n=1 Tax=Ekhidna sp. TaxID=2608089 RepID=UPI003BAB1812
MKKIFYSVTVLLFLGNAQAQSVIKPPKGYSENIGNMVTMLDDLKGRVTRSVANLDQEGTDFLLDEKANRIGAMIMHLAATEVYYQKYTFEGRGFTADENEKWGAALNLGDEGRGRLKDQPISYYLEIWDEVRAETKALLKEKDDKWFSKKASGAMSNHWAWYHVMEHQANHMGQIRLIMGRIPN